ncbi:MAG: DUF1257 domain-containing protein [bacterium]|nr:DUF1257 domain-containing protein [bacterium]
MSHFTKVKTQIKNLVMLKQALDDLNITCVEAEEGQTIEIKGWNKDTTEVLMELKTGSSYSVGVIENQETGTYEFVADWWGIETYTEVTQEQFMNKITQRYAYNTVMDKIKAKGYDLVTEEVDEKEQLHVVLRKWE